MVMSTQTVFCIIGFIAGALLGTAIQVWDKKIRGIDWIVLALTALAGGLGGLLGGGGYTLLFPPPEIGWVLFFALFVALLFVGLSELAQLLIAVAVLVWPFLKKKEDESSNS
jgi:MFS family permease